MKVIAILLHGNIRSDYRVVKTILTLSKKFEVVLYFHGQQEDIQNHFEGQNNIRCKAVQARRSLKQWILRNTFFCLEYDYMVDVVLKSKQKFDFVWANDLPTLHPASVIAESLGAKLIYDSHEIFGETLNQFFIKTSNTLKNSVFTALLRIMRWHGKRMESKLLMRTDLMFTVNESLKEYFINQYGYKRINVLMNIPSSINLSDVSIDFKAIYSWDPSSCIVLYQGSLNSGRGLEILIDSFALLQERYCLVILGDGILKSFLIGKVKEHNLQSRVKFLDSVSLSDLPSFTRGADIGINLLETYNLSKKLASPNKLFEYVHAGIPIVASMTIENQKVFDKFKIGELCDNNAKDVSDKIILVSYHINEYKVGLESAKGEYSWEKQENELNYLIERLIIQE